jgi:hypothetical protein
MRIDLKVGFLGALLLLGCNDNRFHGGEPQNAAGATWNSTTNVGGQSSNTTTSSVGGTGGSSTGTEKLHPIKWVTSTVSLTADDFKLVIDGENYYADTSSLSVHSDPGWSGYTTLELMWQEHDREMRFFIYFSADSSEWWSEEIRTYDGQTSAEWLYYYGDFFRKPLGTAFTGDLVLKNNGDEDAFSGEIHFRNLRLLLSLSSEPPYQPPQCVHFMPPYC